MTATFANYVLGVPVRPSIAYDNGHLDRFKPREPGWRDYAAFAKWVTILEGAETVQGVPGFSKTNLPDALPAYRHFLFGAGQSRTFSYERYVNNDASGKITLANQIVEAQNAALNLYLASGGPIAGASFQFTGTGLGAGQSGAIVFPYPATENWQKAIGAHNFWISGTLVAEVKPLPNASAFGAIGAVDFALSMVVHVEDMYNFNTGGAADIATGIPDADNGRFEITGLGKQYWNYATLTRTVSWRGRNIADYSLSVSDRLQRVFGDPKPASGGRRG